MKVLYILRYFPTLSETFVNLEIAELRAQGVDVEVASLGTRRDGGIAPAPDVPVHRIPRRFGPWSKLSAADSPGSRWLARHQRPRLLSREGRSSTRNSSGPFTDIPLLVELHSVGPH